MCLDVVTPPLHVCQEPGERRPVDDVGAIFRALAVPDRGHVREIAGDLHTAAVVRAEAGFPPAGLRQVDHRVTPFVLRAFRGTPWCPWVRARHRTRSRMTGCNR